MGPRCDHRCQLLQGRSLSVSLTIEVDCTSPGRYPLLTSFLPSRNPFPLGGFFASCHAPKPFARDIWKGNCCRRNGQSVPAPRLGSGTSSVTQSRAAENGRRLCWTSRRMNAALCLLLMRGEHRHATARSASSHAGLRPRVNERPWRYVER